MIPVLGLVLLVAFIFSMLGLGGAQVYAPAFYWLGLDLRTQAVPLALWVSFSSQSAAAVSYWRHGLVQFQAGLPIIGGLILFAPLGALLSHRTPERVILFLFATITMAALVQILVGWRPGGRRRSRLTLIIIGIVGGSAIGFLCGMVGRGGGSLIVPMLLLLGFDPKRAAATSSFGACFSSLAGFMGHVGTAGLRVEPLSFAAVTLCAIAAALAGSRAMARRLDSRRVKCFFAVVLLGIALMLYWEVFAP
jgi:uncharacterized membrane protein YfcA